MLFLLVLLLAAILAVAQPQLGCPLPPPGKSTLQSVEDIICPLSYGGYHIICNPYNHTTAAQACQQHGWQLAGVTDVSAMYALSTVQQCSYRRVWLAAFNGLNQDPMMTMDSQGNLWAGLTNSYTESTFLHVLCQEVPVTIQTVSFTTTATTTVGTLTLSTTVTRHPTHLHCRGDKCNAPINAPLIEKDNLDRRPECKDCGVAVILPGLPTLRLIRVPVPYERAAAACARFGWTLVDYTAGMMLPIIDALSELYPNEAYWLLWLRSYEGVSGGRCLSLRLPKYIGHVAFGLAPSACIYEEAMPLCQCGEPKPTGNGPFVGSTTTATTSETLTIRPTTPSTTLTITSTICEQCAPLRSHPHRRHRNH